MNYYCLVSVCTERVGTNQVSTDRVGTNSVGTITGYRYRARVMDITSIEAMNVKNCQI